MRDLLEGAVYSFYSRPFYFALVRRWMGIGFGFILIGVFIDLFFLGIQVYPPMKQLQKSIPAIVQQLPVVTIKDGRLSVDKPTPYSFQLGPMGHAAWIEVDTRYEVKNTDALTKAMQQNNIIALITADKIITLKRPDNELKISDMKDIYKTDRVITREDWQSMGDNVAAGMMPVMFFIFFLSTLMVDFIITFLSALVAMLVGLIARASLDMGASMRIAAAISIPVDVISSFPLLIGGRVLRGLLVWVVWAGYLVFAVVASKKQDNQHA